MSQLNDQRDTSGRRQHPPPPKFSIAQFGIVLSRLAQFGLPADTVAQFGVGWHSLVQLPALSSDHGTLNEVKVVWRDRPRCDAH